MKKFRKETRHRLYAFNEKKQQRALLTRTLYLETQYRNQLWYLFIIQHKNRHLLLQLKEDTTFLSRHLQFRLTQSSKLNLWCNKGCLLIKPHRKYWQCRFTKKVLLRENLLIFPVCVIRNTFIRKLLHLTISSPFILINQKNA